MIRKISIIAMLILATSLSAADSYYETRANEPGSISVPYSINLGTLEYLETAFTSTEYDYETGDETPDYAPASASMVFNPLNGTASAEVYIYWIYATDGKVSVILNATDLVSEDGLSTIPLKITINSDSGTIESKPGEIIVFEHPDYVSGTFVKDSGTATITLTTEVLNEVPSKRYSADLTLKIISK